MCSFRNMHLIAIICITFLLAFGNCEYDQTQAIRLWDYGRISSCTYDNLLSVNCGEYCNKYRTEMKDIEIIEDSTKSNRAFIFFSNYQNQMVAVFRGSDNLHNWMSNIDFVHTDYHKCHKCKVHEGFYKAYLTLEKQLEEKLKALSIKYSTNKIIITGHSLGGAISTHAAAHFSTLYELTQLYTFGSPRVGNKEFSEWFDTLPIPTKYRVVHHEDIVPHLPPQFNGFTHVNEEVWYYTETGYEKKICSKRDDPKCSDSLFVHKIADHLDYFNLNVKEENAQTKFLTCRGKTQEIQNDFIKSKLLQQ